MPFPMSSIQRVAPYSAVQTDTIVELLEKIYAEEIRLKGRIKTLEQQLNFSKTARVLSPVTPMEMEGSVEETMEAPTVGFDDSMSLTEDTASPLGRELETGRFLGVLVRQRVFWTSEPESL